MSIVMGTVAVITAGIMTTTTMIMILLSLEQCVDIDIIFESQMRTGHTTGDTVLSQAGVHGLRRILDEVVVVEPLATNTMGILDLQG